MQGAKGDVEPERHTRSVTPPPGAKAKLRLQRHGLSYVASRLSWTDIWLVYVSIIWKIWLFVNSMVSMHYRNIHMVQLLNN